MRPDRRALVATLALAVVAGRAHAGPLRLERGWSRPVPAGLSVGVGYGVVVNDGPRPDRLVSASSPAARSVELHESMMSTGPGGAMSHMAPLAGVDVPAHSRVAFAPDGRHMMLLGLKRPLKPGETAPVTLVFQHAGPVRATLAVRTTPP